MLAFLMAGYVFISCFMFSQLMVVAKSHTFKIVKNFGKTKIQVRNKKTGRFVIIRLNPFDLLLLAFN